MGGRKRGECYNDSRVSILPNLLSSVDNRFE
jgi:hypothetical protein